MLHLLDGIDAFSHVVGLMDCQCSVPYFAVLHRLHRASSRLSVVLSQVQAQVEQAEYRSGILVRCMREGGGFVFNLIRSSATFPLRTRRARMI